MATMKLKYEQPMDIYSYELNNFRAYYTLQDSNKEG